VLHYRQLPDLSASIRFMIFVDGSNLLHSAMDAGNLRIQYVKLKDKLTAGRTLVRPYFFGSYKEPISQRQQDFVKALRAMGYEVHMFSTQMRKDSDGHIFFREKGVDVALVTEMLYLCFNQAFDVCCLVGGDNDYVRAVEYVKRQGRRVEVASFRRNLGGKLQAVADKIIYLDDLIAEITY